MDPNANWERQQEIEEELKGCLTPRERSALREELADLQDALNEWLARGGFKPKGYEP